jgi:hypothetical protein
MGGWADGQVNPVNRGLWLRMIPAIFVQVIFNLWFK